MEIEIPKQILELLFGYISIYCSMLGLYEEVRRIEPASSRVETGRARSYIILGTVIIIYHFKRQINEI